MIVGALLGLFFVPLFFVVVRRLFRRRGTVPADREGRAQLDSPVAADHGRP
jgi:hypothetical protein